MKNRVPFLTLALLSLACNQKPKSHPEKSSAKNIAIFEIYLKDTVAVDRLSSFLRDTLELPVEWEGFDIFGNNMVYDAAFYLGNTTLELLAVHPPDSSIREEARYNRILFHTENIDSMASAFSNSGLEHQPPFDFKIASNNQELIIGKQINLDPLSSLSNVNIAMWEYVATGYNFTERTIKGETLKDLKTKLNNAMIANPMGITGLKEIHLSVTKPAIDEWHKLFGPSKLNRWILPDGAIVSYTLTAERIGVDWIALRVRNLDSAREFLFQRNLLSSANNRIAIDPSWIYGLKVYIEE